MTKTGATRYQKFLKSEKAKTKLKSQELPKGTNITKTNFKVKKIVIKEQLRKHDQTEILSSKKLNLQELLMRLNHFNTNNRIEALNGLKELIGIHPDTLNRNLAALLHKITPLVMNVEKVVRRETFKVLHMILSNVAVGKLEAFFNFLSTYLRSAMTHIDQSIQEDSLLFLDILLLYAPEYVVKDFHKILPNFLDMISKLRVDSKPGRTLIITLDNKNTSVKWRVKVLHRLQDFLCRFVEYNVLHENKNVSHVYRQNKYNFYNLFDQRYLDNSCMTILKIHNQSNASDEVGTFSSYVNTLMPLLFEILVEVQPNEGNIKNIENVLSEDAAILLKYVLQVISLLFVHINFLHKKGLTTDLEKTFCNKYRKEFSDNIMKGFPYLTSIRNNKVKQTTTAQIFEDVVTDSQMVVENLEICRLYINFNPNINFKIQNKEHIYVLNYLNKTFSNPNPDVKKIMINILDSIFCNELTSWTKNIQVMDSLFKKLVLAYADCDSNVYLQGHFCLLCKISINDKLHQFHSTNTYDEWLKHMPDILLQSTIASESVNMLHKFCVCRNKVYNDIFKEKQVDIIKNLPLIKIIESGKEDIDLIYSKLYSTLFYYTNKWHPEALTLLKNQIFNQMYSNEHYKYIINMLSIRNKINTHV